MTITHLLNNIVTISRLADIGNNKMALSTVTSDIKVVLQPVGEDKNQIEDGVFGKEYNMYADGSYSILQGDTVRDTDDNYYTVKSGAVTKRQMGNIGFVKIIVELTDNSK